MIVPGSIFKTRLAQNERRKRGDTIHSSETNLHKQDVDELVAFSLLIIIKTHPTGTY